MTLLEVENATFSEAGLVPATDVSLTLTGGQMIVVHGGEQSGKSTLLRGLLGFVPLTKGRATLLGTEITGALTHDAWMELRTRCAYASWTSPLLSNLTVYDNLAIPLLMRSIGEPIARADVERMLALLNLEDVALKRPHEILGKKQRAAVLARALLLPAEVLFVDDPPYDDEDIDRALKDALAAGKGILLALKNVTRFPDAVHIDLVGGVR